MGCGSGRYTLALASYGCKSIVGYDIGESGLEIGGRIAEKYSLKNIEFKRGDVLALPFNNESFDFVFCNGVLHHTTDLKKGLSELYRVLKTGGIAFLYLYADGGLFWNFRKKARELTSQIPRQYAQQVLDILGLPSNRFIFMDTWYVPIETLISKKELEVTLLDQIGFTSIEKTVSSHETDLDHYITAGRPFARELYGDGEHRYLIYK
jgi:ubiquinone/menaquinone biosynthesis C-methylase UbiE